MRSERGFRPAVWLGAVAVILLSVGLLSMKHRPQVKRIVVGLEEDIRGVDPQRELNGLADPVHAHVVEGLVGLNGNLRVGLMLAESLKVSDDGRIYTFTLRPGVRFHNGAILDSSHVKWSWNYLMAPRSLWRCRPLLAGENGAPKVVALETPDARTVVFRLSAASRSFLEIMARPDCAQTPILHPASLKADKSWDRPVGTGPFKVKRRRVGEFAELVRFAGYSSRQDVPSGMIGAKRPLVDELRFLIVGDPSARMMGLQSGDVHIGLIPPPLVAAARQNERLETIISPSTEWNAIVLNARDTLLKDKRIRQAISVAVDRDKIARMVTYGEAEGNISPSPTFTGYFPSNAGSTRADPVRARRLLAASGYHGQPLVITTNKRFQAMFDSAVMVESMLRAVGINARIEVIEWSLQLSRYNSGDYQALSFGYSGRFSPSGVWERFIGAGPPRPWNDPTAIELVRRAEDSRAPEEVKESINKLQHMLEEDVPAVSLFLPNYYVVKNKRVHGYEGSHFETMRLWNVSIDK